jgi:hypothetical protein
MRSTGQPRWGFPIAKQKKRRTPFLLRPGLTTLEDCTPDEKYHGLIPDVLEIKDAQDIAAPPRTR